MSGSKLLDDYAPGLGNFFFYIFFFFRKLCQSRQNVIKEFAQPWDMVISWFPSLEYLCYQNKTKKTLDLQTWGFLKNAQTNWNIHAKERAVKVSDCSL